MPPTKAYYQYRSNSPQQTFIGVTLYVEFGDSSKDRVRDLKWPWGFAEVVRGGLYKHDYYLVWCNYWIESYDGAAGRWRGYRTRKDGKVLFSGGTVICWVLLVYYSNLLFYMAY